MKCKWFVVLLLLVVFSFPIFAGCAPAEEPEEPEAEVEPITLELADSNPPDHVLVQSGNLFKEIVEEKTGSEIEIERYSHGELYDARGLIEAVEVGSAAMGIQHVGFVGARSAVLEFVSSFGALGIWDDKEHYHRFIDNPEVQEMASEEFEEKLNQKLLAMLDYGTGVICTTDEPVKTVEDFEGLRLRAAGPAHAAAYDALGADTVDLEMGEVYMALERGTIDAFGTGPARAYLDRFYEVADYFTQDYGAPRIIFWLTINLDTWNDLSPEQQEIMQEAAEEAKEFSRAQTTEDVEMYQQLLAEEAEEFVYLPDEERAKFREIVSPVMNDLLLNRAGEEVGERLWELMEETR